MYEYRPTRSASGLPPVVKNLLIINCLVAALGLVLWNAFKIDIADFFALYFPTSDHFGIWQPITYQFLHGNVQSLNATIMHLFSNMLALWIFGTVLEPLWGSRRFLFFYLFCGVGAGLCQLGVQAYQLSQMEPAMRQFMVAESATVGASGAVFGILFAFGYLFPNTLLYFYFLVPIKAKWVVAGYIVFELYSGINNNPVDPVAHFAHLGGVLFAFILLKVWKYHYRNRLY